MKLVEYLEMKNTEWLETPREERNEWDFERHCIMDAAALNYYDYKTLICLLLDLDKDLWQYTTYERLSKHTMVRYGIAVDYINGKPQWAYDTYDFEALFM